MSHERNPMPSETVVGEPFGLLNGCTATNAALLPVHYLSDDVRRAAICIGLAAYVHEPETWAMLAPILAARMSLPARKALAFATLASLPDDDLEHVALTIWGDA